MDAIPHNRHLDVIEVKRRSVQGVTHPFLCRAEDDCLYWVKGEFATRKALCREWIAARLAMLLDLPIPPFKILQVSDKLIKESVISDIDELGSGFVFGSRHIEGAMEITHGEAERTRHNDAELCYYILVFDWWIKNGDRILGEKGGNPNILWCAESEKIEIIDHNLAFDDEWSESGFFDGHIFRALRQKPGELDLAVAIRKKMRHTLEEISEIWDELPEEWLYLDQEMILPISLTLDGINEDLERINTEWDSTWGT